MVVLRHLVLGGLEAFVPPSSGDRSSPSMPRRDTLSAVGAAVSSTAVVAGQPCSVTAEEQKPPGYYDPAWQLRLPRNWVTFSTSEVPEDGAPVAVAQAGSMEAETSVSVIRVPLTLTEDTSYEAKTKLIEYFKTPLKETPKVPGNTVANILSDSFQIEAGNVVRFEVVGAPQAEIQNGRRYFTFEYESTQCYGQLVEGVKDLFCQDPEKRQDLPFIDRTHSLKCTVDLQGQPDKDILWLVDVSGPTQDWKKNLSSIVDVTLKSFELGSTESLAKERESFFEQKK